MKILVINGSPKGENSITLQTSRYLQLLYPEQEFSFLHVGAKIRSLERDFTSAAEAIAAAELIVFSYPVYTFLAPSQLHHFIRLLKERGVSLKGKFVTQLTTSKHFYDITAHAYIRDNTFDLGGKYIKGLSADMDDLTTKKGQNEAKAFFEYLLNCCGKDIYENPLRLPQEQPAVPATPCDPTPKKQGDVVLVADLRPEDTALRTMLERFTAVLPYPVRLVNIREFAFQGGCISCFHCAATGECIYRDGFQELLRKEIQTAQAIVLAFRIEDHSMGWLFKTYDDRQFCNGHRTVTMGKPFGYLVCGNLSREENLRTVMEARAQVGGNFLAGIATDEADPDREIDALAGRLSYAVEHAYTQPSDFYGVGGMKIFRDLIWLMQGLMRADHKFYKAHNQYDFPQKKRGTMYAMYLVGAMMNNPTLMKKAGGKMTEGMLMPYTKVLDAAHKQAEKQ